MSTDPIRTAAHDAVHAYERHNPLRTADFHRADCACLRCAIDNLKAALLAGDAVEGNAP